MIKDTNRVQSDIFYMCRQEGDEHQMVSLRYHVCDGSHIHQGTNILYDIYIFFFMNFMGKYFFIDVL